jgi:hypothetical protein
MIVPLTTTMSLDLPNEYEGESEPNEYEGESQDGRSSAGLVDNS